MTETETDVRKAMFKAAKEALVGKQICWPNVSFTPPARGLWFNVNYTPVDKKVATLGTDGQNMVEGFLQVDVNVPLNSGEETLEYELSALENKFVPGFSVAYSQTVAVITACKRSPGRDVGGYWRVSLTIDFYSQTQRSIPT